MKLDLHVHTKYSFDCLASPYRMLLSAKKKGLDGIAITDHNNAKGWKAAKKAAEELNMLVIQGEEIKCKEGVELIGLFLKKEIKSNYHKQNSFDYNLKAIRKQKAVAILAHPFSKKHSFEEIERYAKKVDAIEFLNARRTKKQNKKAQILYKKIKNNVAIVACSDSHAPFEIGTAYTETKAKTLEEFRRQLLKRQTRAKGRLSSCAVHLISKASQLKKFF